MLSTALMAPKLLLEEVERAEAPKDVERKEGMTLQYGAKIRQTKGGKINTKKAVYMNWTVQHFLKT